MAESDSVINKAISMFGNLFVFVYTPLAFCAGLFSMEKKYAPGRAAFWKY